MRGDFSRLTFDRRKHYSSVRMQQGRVQLDADWNEQMDILLHLLQTQVQDWLGAHGGPKQTAGFAISLPQAAHAGPESEVEQTRRPPLPNFEIGGGRYYVDGILCENESPLRFTEQPDYPGAALPATAADEQGYTVYLDVWQQHLSAAEEPGLGEPALGGSDTTTRTRTVWQAKLKPAHEWQAWLEGQTRRGKMAARWNPGGYGGVQLENRLYRVEIHSLDHGQPTFKWSRDNGSVVFAVSGQATTTAQAGDHAITLNVQGLEQDGSRLQPGTWVEIVDRGLALSESSRPLCQVRSVNPPPDAEVTLAPSPFANVGEFSALVNPLLRRWDSGPSANLGVQPVETGRWLALEDGLEVCFEASGPYRVGDYWLIPARMEPDNHVEWPQDAAHQPKPLPPYGVAHHYCQLAALRLHQGTWQVADLRHQFEDLPTLNAESHAGLRQLKELQQEVARHREALEDLLAFAEQIHPYLPVLKEFEAFRREVRKYLAVERTRLFQDFKSEAELRPGEVVALDPAHEDHVLPCNRENESLVLGVVSARPEEERYGDAHVRVTVYGRAHCKVIGEVAPGDLLVPSDVTGCARRRGLFARRGTVIGKALEAHHPGESDKPGTVNIMVTLG